MRNALERITEYADAALSLDGRVDSESLVRLLPRHLPPNAVLCDKDVAATIRYYDILKNAAPLDHLNLAGGAIGSMMAVVTGAGIGCPDRKVVTLVGDGGAMYTVQSLSTQAHEQLDVDTVVLANRRYKVLNNELKRVGASQNGPRAKLMHDLQRPALCWVDITEGLGVSAVRVDARRGFEQAFCAAMSGRGPSS